MRVSLVRVPADHAPRGRRCCTPQRAGGALSRTSLAHLAWTGLILLTAALIVGVELTASCPPGGPVAFGDCERVRPFAIGVVALAALLYVAALSAVRWWTGGLRRRGIADERASRDWYLLTAVLGVVVAPLLAFTLASALR